MEIRSPFREDTEAGTANSYMRVAVLSTISSVSCEKTKYSPGERPTSSVTRRLAVSMSSTASILILLAIAPALCIAILAQEHAEHAAPPKAKPATLMTGYGNWHHPVSTKNAPAQAFFDQGLRLIYAFNHNEAMRSFRRAAELDPKLAMAYWGIAEAVGPNYKHPASQDRFAQAHAPIEKARTRGADALTSDQ